MGHGGGGGGRVCQFELRHIIHGFGAIGPENVPKVSLISCFLFVVLLEIPISEYSCSLQVSWSVALHGCLAVEDLLEGLPELGAEHSVDDGVQGGVEVAHPQEEGYQVRVPLPVLKRPIRGRFLREEYGNPRCTGSS